MNSIKSGLGCGSGFGFQASKSIRSQIDLHNVAIW